MKYIVDKKPNWIINIDPKILDSDSLKTIYQFYVVHTPCEELSARARTLDYYGWNEPWKKPSKLNEKLESISTSDKLIYHADKYDNMEDALKQANLLEEAFHNDISEERVCVYNNKKNLFMSVFYHLRNSLAHGRYNVFETKGDRVFILEDVSSKGKDAKVSVSARMVLFESTLLKWIYIIENGASATENALTS